MDTKIQSPLAEPSEASKFNAFGRWGCLGLAGLSMLSPQKFLAAEAQEATALKLPAIANAQGASSISAPVGFPQWQRPAVSLYFSPSFIPTKDGHRQLTINMYFENPIAVDEVQVLSANNLSGPWKLEQSIEEPIDKLVAWAGLIYSETLNPAADAKFYRALIPPVAQTFGTSSVRPDSRQVLVQDRLADGILTPQYPLEIKGVNWYPEKDNGSEPDQVLYRRWYQEDIALLASSGVNVVRLYSDLGQDQQAFEILDEFHNNGIKVIIPVNSHDRGSILNSANDIGRFVRKFKSHPAVLMWEVREGGEISLNYLLHTIKNIDPNHVVALEVKLDDQILNSDRGGIFPYRNLFATDEYQPDVISLNVTNLRTNNIAEQLQAISSWAFVSDKPFYVSSLNDVRAWDRDIYLNTSASNLKGQVVGAFYDHFALNNFNERPLIDDAHLPTADLLALKDRYSGSFIPTLPTQTILTLESGGSAIIKLGGQTIYQKSGYGGGGRGVNVVAIDTSNGIRVTDIINFDTWLNPALFQDLREFVDRQSDGKIIAFVVADEGGFSLDGGDDSKVFPRSQAAINYFASLGSAEIDNVGFRDSWVFVINKGTGVLAEAYGDYNRAVSPLYKVASVQISLP